MEKTNHLIFSLPLVCLLAAARCAGGDKQTIPFHVGVILDLDTLVGKMGRTSLLMAVDDFYLLNRNYTTRVILHLRDSKEDVVQAAASALDLLQNTQVQAIIGPQQSAQAIFLSELANKSQIPLLSFSATSPSLSSIHTPYFIHTCINDSFQVSGPLSSLIKTFGWREMIPIYEDTEYGRGIMPYLVDTFQATSAFIVYRCVIPPSLSDDQITEELYKLMTMEAKVFIVHMTAALGARLFLKAKEIGMMSKGNAWIMTSGLSNVVDSLDPSIIESMEGSLGLKLYVPRSKELDDFSIRWRRRFQKEYPNDQPAEPNIFELWAYDTVWALAIAAEHRGDIDPHIPKLANSSYLMSLEKLRFSVNGPELLEEILKCRFRGLSGQFNLVDRQLQSSPFQIINIVGRGGRRVGFWTPKCGISSKLNVNDTEACSNLMTDLNLIVWPGDSAVVPKGWQIPVSGRKLRIGVPIKDDFQEFVKVERDPVTNATTVSGFSIDVFEAVVQNLPYAISYEYIPFEDAVGSKGGSYDDLVYQVYLQKYDAAVGDIAIIANRSIYVDFALPYTETGVAMIVPVQESVEKNMWIFLKPLTRDLWLASFAFFFFTGLVVWVMEHQSNDDFQGSFSQQLGIIFYFAFSMLVYAHREKLEKVLSRAVVVIWLFAVLILTSSYTASLSSMLTVRKLQPTVSDINQLQMNGDYVGYQKGTFEGGLLKQHGFDESKIKAYRNPDEYAAALSKGSHNGGVAAIFHGIPYIKLFLSKYCTGYTMVGPVYKAAGMGFIFPKGSPLVPDISRGILSVTEGDTMFQIEKKWFGDHTVCREEESPVTSSNLSFRSFWGLFLITGAASTCAVLIFLVKFFYKNWHELRPVYSNESIWKKLGAWFKYYNRKDTSSTTFKIRETIYADGNIDVSSRHSANTEAKPFGDVPYDEQSQSSLSDLHSNPCEEEITSIVLATTCTDDQLAL